MGLKYINQNGEEVIIAGKGKNGKDGKDGGVSTGSVIGWTGEEIPEGYEEVDSSLIPSGVEVGAVIGYTGEGTPEGYDEVKRGYSTEEILTGETWTNGKPIYRKIVDFGTLPNTNIKNYDVGISNVDFLLPPRGVANNGSEDITIPNTYAGASFTYIDGLTVQHANNTISTVSIRTNSDRSKYSAYVILEYTKTTDTGNFKYIEKKSVTPIEPKTGHIYDTTNIDNKAENTYSANVIDGNFLNKGKIIIHRNLSCKFSSNVATVDISPSGFTDNNYIGFVAFPYNNIYDAKLVADTTTQAKIQCSSISDGSYYVNIFIIKV